SPGTSKVCIASSTQRSSSGGAPAGAASAPAGGIAAKKSAANAARKRLRAWLECVLVEAAVDNVLLPGLKVGACYQLEHYSPESDFRTRPHGGLLQRAVHSDS